MKLLSKTKYRRLSHNYLARIEKLIVINTLLVIFLAVAIFPTACAVAPKYETAYACEGKTLSIECEKGDLINLIRANYGRFSITICNDHGNTDWSVNCMSPKSLRVLNTKCAHKQNCSVLASTNMFGDPCPGTHKYLEAHYLCVSAAQTATTTNRPSPPWLITSPPNVWSTSTAHDVQYTTSMINNSTHNSLHENNGESTVASSRKTTNRPSSVDIITQTKKIQSPTYSPVLITPAVAEITTPNTPYRTTTFQEQLLYTGDVNSALSVSVVDGNSTPSAIINLNSNTNNDATLSTTNEFIENYYCSQTTARNLYWNLTRVGEINVQPCPGGATGIAKWRCVFEKIKTNPPINGKDLISSSSQTPSISGIFEPETNTILRPVWQPRTPDLTQCRSLWLNSLEIRVNQRDSSLVSIANDLSQVTSSKTLYGGDMLVTTKIIQTMSEKMMYDIETFPDQRQREAIVFELLLGIVKTGSNLLDATQQLSWLDLSFEDQMRVATSLLTGLEDNAFLLAETIIRERNVVFNKAKNILLSVRVLETRNIVANEIFPDLKNELWQVSDDRIELPRAALIENSDGGLVRIVFVAFDRLESILKPSNIMVPSDTANSPSKYPTNSSKQMYHATLNPVFKNRILNSKVISASLGKGRHIQLSQPIRLILKHLVTENVTNPSCVFWNYIDHAWSEDGCFVEITNKTHTICTCNHLTNFAILMEAIDNKVIDYLHMFDEKILIMIYISVTICVIFIFLAILTLKFLNGIFVKVRANHTNISNIVPSLESGGISCPPPCHHDNNDEDENNGVHARNHQIRCSPTPIYLHTQCSRTVDSDFQRPESHSSQLCNVGGDINVPRNSKKIKACNIELDDDGCDGVPNEALFQAQYYHNQRSSITQPPTYPNPCHSLSMTVTAHHFHHNLQPIHKNCKTQRNENINLNEFV